MDNGLWRVVLCMLFFPLLCTGLVSFRCLLAGGCGAAGPRGCRAQSHISSRLGLEPGMVGDVGRRQWEGPHLCEAHTLPQTSPMSPETPPVP